VAAFLENALFSIARQTYGNFEIVLVDDGSTDATPRIIARFKKLLPVVHVHLKKNSGLPHALNIGLSKATGDFIARFDADDFMLKYRLEDQVNFLLEHENIDLVGGGAKLFGHASGEHHQKRSHEEILNEFLVNNPFIHPTIMFRRKLYDDGLFAYGESLPNEEDYELWSRLLPKIRCQNIHYPLIKYRIHGSNSQRNPGKKGVKKEAIESFLMTFGYSNAFLVEALAEYQCSGFLDHSGFKAARDYVAKSSALGLPRLGWLHDRILRARNYQDFMERL
jgi:glycosyltransferase involved in cell wall biosynthesis